MLSIFFGCWRLGLSRADPLVVRVENISVQNGPIQILQNSIIRYMRDYFDCLEWQIVKSIIDISIPYLFTYQNIILNPQFSP